MAIFFAALCRLYPDEKYLKISDQVIRQLFAHTDQMEAGKVKAERWGLFTGEASFVYTYHILYKLTGNTIYVKYEKKHANWLTDCITEIDGYDIIDGKAGVLAALVCLYEDTDDGQYIETAKCVAKELLGQAQSMQAGIGWPHKDRPALAGMAHGNSGIALALAMLWKQTGEDILWTTIEKAIAYEDSLYDFTFENWMDIRDIHHKDGKPQSMIAWCHGLAGIMAARLKIHTLTGMSLDTLFGTVIHADENGEISFNKMTEKIINSQKREMCLCHGALGLEMLVGRPVGENDVLSFEDWNSPGMMTGLAGIGYAMLCRKDPLLPSILLLD
jgi:lantibiotic modifying enzyme